MDICALLPGLGNAEKRMIPWVWICYVWAYSIVWIIIEDWTKMFVYSHLNMTAPCNGAS